MRPATSGGADVSPAVGRALAWFAAHKNDGTPEVDIVRDLLSEHAERGLQLSRYMMAVGTLGGENGPAQQAAALEMLLGAKGATS